MLPVFCFGRRGASEWRREMRTVMMAFIKYLHPTRRRQESYKSREETSTSHIATDWIGDRARTLCLSTRETQLWNAVLLSDFFINVCQPGADRRRGDGAEH
jgi:hypothetical protein